MDSIREQMDLTNEISDAISNPVGMGHDLDEVSIVKLHPDEGSLLWLSRPVSRYTDPPFCLCDLRTSSRTNWRS